MKCKDDDGGSSSDSDGEGEDVDSGNPQNTYYQSDMDHQCESITGSTCNSAYEACQLICDAQAANPESFNLQAPGCSGFNLKDNG